MRTLKVQLLVRVRLSSGYKYANPVWNKNGSLREGYACVGGKPELHPEGVYYLRYLQGGKRRWHAVGASADEADAALQNKEHDLQAISLGRTAPEAVQAAHTETTPPASTGSPTRLPLADAVEDYLANIRRFRLPKTIAACEYILGVFSQRLPGRLLDSITREDLLDHRAALEQRRTPRTVYNHMMRINTFLRSKGITGLLRPEDKPVYDEPEVEAYDPDQLQALFAAATPDERLLFEFFLQTGFRDQEVAFSSWRNVDFKGKLIKVLSKPELGK